MNYITNLNTPQIEKIHSGKVRESFRIDDRTRMIIATDRISSFDNVLETAIPGKGAVLNQMAAYWFDKTSDIIDNHLIELIDPNISLVKEVKPIRLEMIVRSYLTGSMLRKYKQGKRTFSGVDVPDGLKKHQKFPELLVTPTTKEESDREISPEEIVEEGWIDKKTYEQMAEISKELFKRAQDVLFENGLILVDTKYEFGLLNGKLILIDEIHTPDSSRFWYREDYEKDPENVTQMDKEFVRAYLLKHKKDGEYPTTLPQDIVDETTRRYQELYEKVTGDPATPVNTDIKARIYKNLLKANLIKEGYVAIIMGSKADMEHCLKMKQYIEDYGIRAYLRVMSAHKNGEDVVDNVSDYNNSIEPGAVIAVAGLSNGLGGALGANLSIPVINCPPFKDKVDIFMNVNSSLMMPSKTPAATIIKPESAAAFALRSLNINRLRDLFREEITSMKRSLREDDENVRKL